MALFGSLYRVGRHVCKLPLGAARYRAASTFSSCEYLNVNLNDDTGIAQIEMCRKPVNAMPLETLAGITDSIKALEKEESCKGVVFTSNVPKVFSGGLELSELYKPDLERLKRFWVTLQDMWSTVYSTPLVTIAAISGHSPAGGCLLSLTCDVRVFVNGNYIIGLNETPVGLVAPFWLQDNMINVLGYRQAEKALQRGKLFTPQEALQAGLVDEVVNPEDLTQAVEKQMKALTALPDHARSRLKGLLRAETLQRFEARRQEDLELQIKLITSPECQVSLGEQVNNLKKKK